jgi:uncharacterized protein YhbP (UPF0306 family)
MSPKSPDSTTFILYPQTTTVSLLFKIDNNKQVVAYDKNIYYIYNEQNNLIPYPATQDTRHLSELFGQAEPAAKQLRKGPTAT